MDKAVLFWILVGGVGFLFALAVQMRVMVALVLRRALKAWRPAFEDRVKANSAVLLAAATQPPSLDPAPETLEGAEHLRATYPAPLGHLRTARRYSVVLPVMILVLIGLGRTVLGVI